MNAERFTSQWKRLPHPIRWIVAACVGGTLVVLGLIFMVLPGPGIPILLLGLVFMVLPGPGIPILILGLLVLATEFAWAEVLLRRVKTHGANAGRMARDAARRVRGRKAPTIDA